MPRQRFLAALLVTAALCAPAVASAQLHLSLWHPLSTNSDPDAHANLALSVFQSRLGQLHGLGLHPFVSEVSGDSKGIVVTGAYERVGGDANGLHVTGGLGSTRGNARGIHVTGIGEFVEGGFTGLQSTGVVNRVQGDVKGIQLAGFVNTNGGETRGIQVSSVANVSEGGMHGLQLAAGINLAQGEMNGLQVGLGNLAGTAEGSQVGFYNVASMASGFQFGVINYASMNTGIPFGVINLSATNGAFEIVGYGSTFSAVNVGVRTTVNRWQSTFAAGGGDLEGDVSTAGFLTWAYGYKLPLGSTFSIGVDAGFTHVMPKRSDEPGENDRLHYGISLRALPEIRFSHAIALFGGPGVTKIYDAYETGAGTTTEFLGTLGLAVRP